MPFKSKLQERYFFANKEEFEKKGIDVNEWAKSTNQKKLPEKALKKKEEKKR